jgi:hypothetical protein
MECSFMETLYLFTNRFFVMVLQYLADIISLITKREMPFPPVKLEEIIK